MIHLIVQGEPQAKGRPRFNGNTGRVYTPPRTAHAEERIRGVWRVAGAQTMDGPLELNVVLVLARPKTHYKVNGQLTTEGLRHPWPTKKPDLDNSWKLVADSLQGCAYRDDKQIVRGQMVRRWAKRDEYEHTEIVITKMPLPLLGTVAA